MYVFGGYCDLDGNDVQPTEQNCIGVQTTPKTTTNLRLIFPSKSKSFKPTDTESRFFQFLLPRKSGVVWCPAFFIFDSKTHKPIQTVIRPNPILPTQTFLTPEPEFTYTNFSDAPNPILPTQTLLEPRTGFRLHFFFILFVSCL